MERFIWICAAGAAGTGARYLIGLYAAQRFGTAFPYGTLLVNLGGCFVMGAVVPLFMALSLSETTRQAITVGFLGGLTTYSAFNLETTRLFEAGAYGSAITYVVATVPGALVAGLLGMWCMRLVLTRV